MRVVWQNATSVFVMAGRYLYGLVIPKKAKKLKV